ALQVVADDVVPHQVVGPQEAEGGGQLLAFQQARAVGRVFADVQLERLHGRLVDEDVDDAGVVEIEEGGQQRDACRRILAARGKHRQCGGKDGAADAEAQRVDLLAAADLVHDA